MKQITGKTKLTCLLGSPVSHSKSPLMHNEAFAYHDLDYVYLAFDIKSEDLESTFQTLRSMNVRGFNLTMPLKTKACTFCDQLSPAAKIIGSINTVVNDNGVFTGYATDGIGFLRSLKDLDFQIKGKKMTILGAGGAATSIYVQAALEGASAISIFSRPGHFYERAQHIIEILKEYTDCQVHLFNFDNEDILRKEISESSLLVNGTSVGMAPNIENSLITDVSLFHNDLLVSDIIYNPAETRFLKLAKEAGCRTQNGLPMLLYQGAEAFKLWTDREMPVELIKTKYFL